MHIWLVSPRVKPARLEGPLREDRRAIATFAAAPFRCSPRALLNTPQGYVR
jgi:hypothetical protein